MIHHHSAACRDENPTLHVRRSNEKCNRRSRLNNGEPPLNKYANIKKPLSKTLGSVQPHKYLKTRFSLHVKEASAQSFSPSLTSSLKTYRFWCLPTPKSVVASPAQVDRYFCWNSLAPRHICMRSFGLRKRVPGWVYMGGFIPLFLHISIKTGSAEKMLMVSALVTSQGSYPANE